MQPLAIWLTCVYRPTRCMVASNCVPRRLGLCRSRAPGLLPVSTASLSMDHEHGTVCQLILEHQIRLCTCSFKRHLKAQPVSAVVYAAAGRWVQHRSSGAVVTVLASSAPFTNIQTYLLTYLLTKWLARTTEKPLASQGYLHKDQARVCYIVCIIICCLLSS